MEIALLNLSESGFQAAKPGSLETCQKPMTEQN
jgi:hypothetical protein